MVACSVDYARCDALVALVRRLGGFPPDAEDPIKISLPPEQMATVNLVTVAICHQTTPFVGPHLMGKIDGQPCRGWDYLWRKWIRRAEERPDLLPPKALAEMTSEVLTAILSDGQGGGVISDLERRAGHIVDLGRVMLDYGWNSPVDMLHEAEARIGASDQEGLRRLLRSFRAFATDPLEKKSRYLLALQRTTAGWQYVDLPNLGTPVDYHEVRLHLRLGTVRLHDTDLARRLVRRQPVTTEEDVAIRGAVNEVINLTAAKLKVTPATMHCAFWNYARNLCPRDQTYCKDIPERCGLPQRYRPPFLSGCPFAPICASRNLDVAVLPAEHVFNTDWY